MRNEMKKKDRLTEIYFNEQDNIMYGRTYNTKFKNQLRQLTNDYPDQCRIMEEPECGMIEFEINKDRLTFRINPEISEERRKELSDQAKKNNNLLRKDIS